jgi:D-serine deaminase-like pyridoxal phosphate-dependent protein
MNNYQYYKKAIKGQALPLAYIDLDKFDANVEAIRKRAGDKPIRIASKSVRCQAMLRRILDSNAQYQGIMCYSAREAAWLASQGFDDLLVAYPTLQAQDIWAVLEQVAKGKRIYLMTDSAEQLKHLNAVAAAQQQQLPIFVDLDMSSRWSFLHFGVHRSGIWNEATLGAYLSALQKHSNLQLVGAMGYEAQIAGLGDQAKGKALLNRAIRAFQARSRKEVAKRRATLVAQIKQVVPGLQIVNAGGTGSLESSREEEAVTEVTAGSGFYAPTLFDAYSRFQHQPAAGFAIEIVRQPQPHLYTCLGGGYVASGAIGKEKAPEPTWPQGAKLTNNEMAGEVQTPVEYKGSEKLALGDPIFLRHCKAGELCEHFQQLQLIQGGQIVEAVPTYRGEGMCFL